MTLTLTWKRKTLDDALAEAKKINHLYRKRELSVDHEGEWERVQRMRRENHYLVRGGRAVEQNIYDS